jgi:hypothetical protein
MMTNRADTFEQQGWQTLAGYLPLGLAGGETIGTLLSMTPWLRRVIGADDEILLWKRITDAELALTLGALPSEL